MRGLKATGEKIWSYADSRFSESWSGSFATRDEVISEAREVLKGNAEFYIAECDRPDPADIFTSADRLFEDANERANDECIETDWPELSVVDMRRFEVEYRALIRRFLPECPFWIVDTKTIERIVTHVPQEQNAAVVPQASAEGPPAAHDRSEGGST